MIDWITCEGGTPLDAGGGWYRCPTCRWVGWKVKQLPSTTQRHRRPIEVSTQPTGDNCNG